MMVSGRKAKRRSPRPPASERLFEFQRAGDQFVCELRNAGRWGTEARFLRNGKFLYSRRHKTRELAIAWAEAERKQLERDARYREDLKPLALPKQSDKKPE
jgi:hypothetical protein